VGAGKRERFKGNVNNLAFAIQQQLSFRKAAHFVWILARSAENFAAPKWINGRPIESKSIRMKVRNVNRRIKLAMPESCINSQFSQFHQLACGRVGSGALNKTGM
jgi:hypothetical protein